MARYREKVRCGALPPVARPTLARDCVVVVLVTTIRRCGPPGLYAMLLKVLLPSVLAVWSAVSEDLTRPKTVPALAWMVCLR